MGQRSEVGGRTSELERGGRGHECQFRPVTRDGSGRPKASSGRKRRLSINRSKTSQSKTFAIFEKLAFAAVNRFGCNGQYASGRASRVAISSGNTVSACRGRGTGGFDEAANLRSQSFEDSNGPVHCDPVVLVPLVARELRFMRSEPLGQLALTEPLRNAEGD